MFGSALTNQFEVGLRLASAQVRQRPCDVAKQADFGIGLAQRCGHTDRTQNVSIIPPLIAILRNAEFDIKKEAAWAISNASSGASADHIRYLVRQGAIGPLCDLFSCPDPKIILVALEGIENILKVGQDDAPKLGGVNKFSEYVEECGGLDMLEDLQRHDNEKIYEKAVKIIRSYFDT